MKDNLLNIIIGLLVIIIVIVVVYMLFFRNKQDETDYERMNEEQVMSEDV